MSLSNLPQPIARFLTATAARDRGALLACFTPEAVLVDKHRSRCGDEIEDWVDQLYFGAQVRVHPIHHMDQADAVVLIVILEGDYSAYGITGPFQYEWVFTLDGDQIARLQTTQQLAPDAPTAVLTYIRATNSFDLDGAVAAFSDDALVNDQRREYRGREAIRAWLQREIIGDRVTMFVTECQRHGMNTAVRAIVEGDYDKSGLPDPLKLNFYFTDDGARLSQLIVLPEPRAAA